MDPLIDIRELWLAGLEPLHVLDDAGVILAEARAREQAAARGLGRAAREAFVTAVVELARNVVVHAYGGWVACRDIVGPGGGGVEAVVVDAGRGITDPTGALRGQTGARRGLGAGFSGAYRLLDEMDVDIRYGEGTFIAARKFVAAPRARRELAIIGAPMADEGPSGDHALARRDGESVRFTVLDGVGHGAAAREAADRAAACFIESAGERLEETLRRCDDALRGTRGAAMLLGCVTPDDAGARVDELSVGNVELRVVGYDPRSVGGRINGVVGMAHRRARRVPGAEGIRIGADEAVAAFTDGIPARATLRPGAHHQPALAIADELFAQRRGDDDALVFVFKVTRAFG